MVALVVFVLVLGATRSLAAQDAEPEYRCPMDLVVVVEHTKRMKAEGAFGRASVIVGELEQRLRAVDHVALVSAGEQSFIQRELTALGDQPRTGLVEAMGKLSPNARTCDFDSALDASRAEFKANGWPGAARVELSILANAIPMTEKAPPNAARVFALVGASGDENEVKKKALESSLIVSVATSEDIERLVKVVQRQAAKGCVATAHEPRGRPSSETPGAGNDHASMAAAGLDRGASDGHQRAIGGNDEAALSLPVLLVFSAFGGAALVLGLIGIAALLQRRQRFADSRRVAVSGAEASSAGRERAKHAEADGGGAREERGTFVLKAEFGAQEECRRSIDATSGTRLLDAGVQERPSESGRGEGRLPVEALEGTRLLEGGRQGPSREAPSPVRRPSAAPEAADVKTAMLVVGVPSPGVVVPEIDDSWDSATVAFVDED